ncbi:MAG TPA: serine/threonine-protein kinase, partial [Chitinispirillaceae bacterium]|nr:serine/threonine-protein kinase [Chitinispirillaceae bacterium]
QGGETMKHCLPSDLSQPVKLGSGGYGTVYRARQKSIDRTVVVKVVYERDAARRAKIRREAAVQAELDMAGIPHIYDIREQPDRVYIVMEWIRGCDLRTLLDTKQISETERDCIIYYFVKLVASLHNRGFAHRDLKPQNIIINSKGVYLIDFGLTLNTSVDYRTTMSLTIKGTPAYIAPELLQGKGASSDPLRADVYAMGKIITELYGTQTVPEYVENCRAENPEKRFASAVAVLDNITIPAYTVPWEEITGSCTAKVLAQQLYSASMESIRKHHFEDAYELLVETIQTDPEHHDALLLLDRFPSMKQRYTVQFRLMSVSAGIAALIVVAAGIILLQPGKLPDEKGTNVAQDISSAPMVRIEPQSQAALIDTSLRFKEEPYRLKTLDGTLIVTSGRTDGNLVIDSVQTMTGDNYKVGLFDKTHTLLWQNRNGEIRWRALVTVLPFEEKRIHIKDK